MKKVLIGLVVLVIVFLGVGFSLPARVTVERSLLINAGAERIFQHIAELRRWPEWTVWNTTKYPKIAYRYEGPEQGVGATSIWTDPDNGDGRLVVTAFEPGRRLGFDLYFASFPKSTGAIELSPGKDGIMVRWHFTCDMGANPIGRWFGLLMDGMAGAELESNLAKLAERCR